MKKRIKYIIEFILLLPLAIFTLCAWICVCIIELFGDE